MNLSVIKDNQQVFHLNLEEDVQENKGAPLTIFMGRSEGCQVLLDDKQVSREHAKIHFEAGLWTIENISDFSSLLLNGSQCDSAQLKNGDLVSIGPFSINVSMTERSNVDDSHQSVSLGSNNHGRTHAFGLGLGDEATEMMTEGVSRELDEFKNENRSDLAEENHPEEKVGQSLESLEETGEFSSGDEFQENFPESDFDQFSEVGEEEDDFAVESYDENSKTHVFQNFSVFELELFGEYTPYDAYRLDKEEVTIGRDEGKCDIVLNDPEVSAVHATVKKGAISCTLTDLKSGNGTIFKGERINSAQLSNGDEFIIGSTTFTVRVLSDFLEKEKDRIMPVDKNQVIEVEEVVEVGEDYEGDEGEVVLGDEFNVDLNTGNAQSILSKEAWKNPQQRAKFIRYIAILALVYFGLDLMEEKPKTPEKKVSKKEEVKTEVKKIDVKPLTEEEKQYVEGLYLLSKQYVKEGKYSEAIIELDKLFAVTPRYKEAQQVKELAKRGLEEKTRLLEEERKEKERRLRELKVKELVAKAREAVDNKKVELAEKLFAEIVKLDPENFEYTQMKIEIDAYKKEQERIALEEAQKEAERKRQIQELSPGKTFFLSKEWYKATLKLQDFLQKENLDEDLIKEASEMLTTAKNNLNGIVGPMMGKARSLKEGQDLKGAYETYLEVLKYHPAHEEALNEMADIRETLEIRSKKVYREAIIDESLSQYDTAREKFQEVQQISPSDSEYYLKATEKLKDYLD